MITNHELSRSYCECSRHVVCCMRETAVWRSLKSLLFAIAICTMSFCLGIFGCEENEIDDRWAAEGEPQRAGGCELKQEATNDEHVVHSFGLLPTEEHEHLCSQEEM